MSHDIIKPQEENTGIIKKPQESSAANAIRQPVNYSSAVIRPDYAASVNAENQYVLRHSETSDGERDAGEQRRRNESTNHIKPVNPDGDIETDRHRHSDTTYETGQKAEPIKGKQFNQYQAERYGQPDVEKPMHREARYGSTEEATQGKTVIGGVAGNAATVDNEKSIIKPDATGVAGTSVIKESASEAAKESIIKKPKAKVFAKKIKEESGEQLKKQGLLKTVGGIAVRETSAAIGYGGDELTDKVQGHAVKYGYKAGKYAALSGIALTKGTYGLTKEIIKQRKELRKLNYSPLKKATAKKIIKDKVKTGIGRSVSSIQDVIKNEVGKGIEDFHGSDDLGIKALAVPKDVYLKTKRTVKTVRAAARATRTAVHVAKSVAKGAKNFIAKALASKVGLFVVGMILCAVTIAAIIDTIVPNITLKSDNKELTRTYKYITELDADLTDEIRSIPNNKDDYNDIDVFHFYVNGYATSAKDITIYTNADYVLMYLDVKYDDYAFDKLIYGILGGTNVKGEIDKIHDALYSYSTERWEETETYSSTSTDPETGEVTYDSWTETIYHLDIKVSIQSFEQYLSDNITTLLTDDEQERFTVLAEVGAYTAHIELGNPFGDEDYFISSRWGKRIHPITGDVAMHNGIDIPKESGTPIQNVMAGQVSFVGYNDDYGNYCTVTSIDGKRKVLYAHMQSVEVLQGQEINKRELIGYVGSTGSSTGSHLHLEYSIKDGLEMLNTNPAFFLDGASYAGIDSDDIVAVAASQIGNVGGRPYWTWYGFRVHVHWCACFVSWCANECGYIKGGQIPKYSSCTAGVEWFQSHGLWQNGGGGYIPKAGDIIFIDWPNVAGRINHTGIVESYDSESSTVKTIEGNSGNQCRRQTYNLYSGVIYGYGTPEYPAK